MHKIIMVLLLSLFPFFASQAGSFNPERMQLVDVVTYSENGGEGKNLLFRGNMPVLDQGTSDARFAYDELVTQMRLLAGDDFPDKPFFIYDINLFNPLKDEEKEDMRVQEKFFDNHPDLGDFTSKVIYPKFSHNLTGTNEIDSLGESKEVSSHIQKIKIKFTSLSDLMKSINKKLALRNENLTYIVYLHCEAGCDRTGAAMAAYQMFEMKSGPNLTAEQALQATVDICQRKPDSLNRKIVKKYCKKKKHGKDYHCSVWD